MPVPQENLVFVEQASCLLLKIVQDFSENKYYFGIRRVKAVTKYDCFVLLVYLNKSRGTHGATIIDRQKLAN